MTEGKEIDTVKYLDFVNKTTSDPSSDFAAFLTRATKLEAEDGADFPRLLTSAIGIAAEAGEFAEVVKKIAFQGKEYDEGNIFHMKRELGDIMWYVAQACIALNTDLNEILEMNYDKLSARYPKGTFDVYYSENRAEGDL